MAKMCTTRVKVTDFVKINLKDYSCTLWTA